MLKSSVYGDMSLENVLAIKLETPLQCFTGLGFWLEKKCDEEEVGLIKTACFHELKGVLI